MLKMYAAQCVKSRFTRARVADTLEVGVETDCVAHDDGISRCWDPKQEDYASFRPTIEYCACSRSSCTLLCVSIEGANDHGIEIASDSGWV